MDTPSFSDPGDLPPPSPTPVTSLPPSTPQEHRAVCLRPLPESNRARPSSVATPLPSPPPPAYPISTIVRTLPFPLFFFFSGGKSPYAGASPVGHTTDIVFPPYATLLHRLPIHATTASPTPTSPSPFPMVEPHTRRPSAVSSIHNWKLPTPTTPTPCRLHGFGPVQSIPPPPCSLPAADVRLRLPAPFRADILAPSLEISDARSPPVACSSLSS